MLCETVGRDSIAPGFRIPFVHVQQSSSHSIGQPNTNHFYYSFLVAPDSDDDDYDQLDVPAAADEESSGVSLDFLPVPVPTWLWFEDEEEPDSSDMDDDYVISIRKLFESDSMDDEQDFQKDELDENRNDKMPRGLHHSDWCNSWTYWHPDEDHNTWTHQCSNHPPTIPNQLDAKKGNRNVPKLGRSGRFLKSTRKLAARVGRSIMNCFCLPCRKR
jgi:hypothetical protein